MTFHREEAFDNGIINIFPHLIHINVVFDEMDLKSWERPFAASVIFFGLFILYETVTFLIDAVICEMGELIALYRVWVVKFSGKSYKTFIVNIKPQRVNACENNVNANVEF